MILITREHEKSLDIAKKIENYSDYFIEDLISIEKVKYEKNRNHYDYLIITSNNALYAIEDFSYNNILIIGEKITGQNIINFSDVQEIINYVQQNISTESKTLYLRSTKISKDINNILNKHTIDEVIVYKPHYRESFSEECIQLFKEKELRYILLFSKNTGKTLKNLIKKHNLENYLQNTSVLSLSKNINNQILDIQWKQILYSEKPNQESLINKLINLIKDSKY